MKKDLFPFDMKVGGLYLIHAKNDNPYNNKRITYSLIIQFKEHSNKVIHHNMIASYTEYSHWQLYLSNNSLAELYSTGTDVDNILLSQPFDIKDLPLYLHWDRTPLFDTLLKGE